MSDRDPTTPPRRFAPPLHAREAEAVSHFVESLASDAPPEGLTPLAQALWHDGRGAWDRAHAMVQAEASPEAAAVHAYLHRKEGDLANADYWYARAARSRPAIALEREWRELVAAALGAGARC
jgi:hypothetical protein